MEDHSSTQSFSNLHHHRHRPFFPITLPSFQSSEEGYPSSQPAQGSLELHESQREESTITFLTSNTSSGARRSSSGGDRVFLNTSASSLDGEAGLGGHFDDSWYGGGKKEAWDDGESCESPADDFHANGDCYGNANDVFYAANCASEEGARCRVRANHNTYTRVGCEAKSESAYNGEANVSHLTKQTASYNTSGAGSFNDGGVDYCRTDSRVGDHYLGREEDYGSGCGSGEEPVQAAEVEGPWLSVSPSSQSEGRWREAAADAGLPQRSLIGLNSRTYTQKLDSFSEAFLSQRKRRFPVTPSGDSSGQVWEFGAGRGETPELVKLRQSCAFDSDSYLPHSSSSSSPAHPCLPPFPSPPTSSPHLMSSVLSPPPTPLPPPSHSPSKMDSPGAFTSSGHSFSQGGESLGVLQFFTSHLQSVPSVHSPGMLWKFPLLTSHGFQPSSGDAGNTDCNLTSAHGDDFGNITANHDILQTPEPSFHTSTSLHPSRALCPPSSPSLHPSFHLPSLPSHFFVQHHEAAEKTVGHAVIQKVKNGPANQNQSHLQQQTTPVYTGRPFPSILHSSRVQNRVHYTPLPLLNPVRKGAGLYSSISSPHHREEEPACAEEEEEDCRVLPYVNVGPDFQADLPPCFADGEWSEVWSPEEESPREQLLWKPWDEESDNVQAQVEKLLSMCSSSCLPGGGSNTELALHCLHYCQGNTMATLEMLLFSQPLPTGDYHYSGCDFWTDTEKSLFTAALGTYGKDFKLLEKTVRTKKIRQCVEIYYLSKKLLDKQKKQLDEEKRDGELEQQKSVTPIREPVERHFGLEEAVPVPSLASFFPCKLCGKMFYKIKSRNAHMKIHRQPQEDWSSRRLQQHLLNQRLTASRPTSLMPILGGNVLPTQAPALTFPPSGLSGTSSSNADSVHNSVTNSNPITPSNAIVLNLRTAVSYGNIALPDSHVIANIDGGDSEPTAGIPFHQSWASFGHAPDPATFYCNPESKEDVGGGTVERKEPINWQ